MNNSTGRIWREITDWHKEQHKRDLTAAFELGDFLQRAVIFTGMPTEQVIRKVIVELGDLAYGESTYRRSAQLVKTYTENQRKVLIEKGVTLNRAVALAGAEFDKRRLMMIVRMKRGELNPSRICGASEKRRLQKEQTMRNLVENPRDVIAIQISDHGVPTPDRMEDGLRSLVSQVEQPTLIERMNTAIEKCRKSGLQLAFVGLKRI